MKTQTQKNPLATIFFVFGALHIYSMLQSDRRNSFEIISKGIKIFRPVLVQIFIIICLGTTFIEAVEILETSLH
ncbi:MAG: hypothetical protein QNJ38_13455 [Prochloraceae cyanobacterium]|nr:hypothetical protein [Prochloraceae cyanobacterium]